MFSSFVLVIVLTLGTLANCFYLQRVEIFHEHVQDDRHRLGLSRSRSEPQSATYITCHRGRILEDGYTQLSLLSADALKKAVKVKFINEQVRLCVCARRGDGVIERVEYNGL